MDLSLGGNHSAHNRSLSKKQVMFFEDTFKRNSEHFTSITLCNPLVHGEAVSTPTLGQGQLVTRVLKKIGTRPDLEMGGMAGSRVIPGMGAHGEEWLLGHQIVFICTEDFAPALFKLLQPHNPGGL